VILVFVLVPEQFSLDFRTSFLVHLFDSTILVLMLFVFCGNYTICNSLVKFVAKYDILNSLGL
jgi:hypothetical protein